MDMIETPDAPDANQKSSIRLEERVYADLLDAIRFGRFALGERLPSENEIARDHSVSRPVVRMALARLREDGLIVSRQGAGSFVSSGVAGEGAGFAPLGSIEDIGSYFRFRRFIEAETAMLAARNCRQPDVEHLRKLIADVEACGDIHPGGADPDFEFHAEIARLSNNRFLSGTMHLLRAHMIYVGRFSRSLRRTGHGKGTQEVHSEHRALLQAIEAGDEERAHAAMVSHIDRSEQRVFKGE